MPVYGSYSYAADVLGVISEEKVRERDEEDGEEIGRAREEIQEEEIAGMERREEGREENEREAQEEDH